MGELGAYVLAADVSGAEEETAVVLGDQVRPFRCDAPSTQT